MSTNREGSNIWVCLTKRYPSGQRMTHRLFERRFWTSGYLWHDSFGSYLNRLVCPVIGHRKVHNIADPGEPKRIHCFNCEQDIKP